MISKRVKRIGTSPTLRITAKAKAMRAEGIDVVDLSVGEPDFATPRAIREAGKRAIDENITKYTANEGLPALRDAIIAALARDYGVAYERSEIIVSSGAKQSLFNAVMALVNEGEEVIIPSPYWVSYPEMVALAGGTPVIVPTKEENGFRMTPEELKQALSVATKAIILNNPSNPTGALYTRGQLEELAAVCGEEEIVVIADEIYDKLVYDSVPFTSYASLPQAARDKTLLINGVSKAYAMTGWRIGFAAGPPEIISSMAKIQSHSTSNASSISQMASIEAFSGHHPELPRMLAEFQKRRNYALYKLETIPGVSCARPDGAFYLFPNISAFIDKSYEGTLIRNSYGLAYTLLKEAHVAIVPGAAFGAENYIRISYATSMENLEKGLDRIVKALGKMKTPTKVKRRRLANTITRTGSQPPTQAPVEGEMGEALVAEAKAHLNHDTYHEWNVNINGVIVQLRTNITHLYDFWVENWYPAQLEGDTEPHGIIYAVEGVTGREPHAFYNSETQTGVIFNCDHYPTLRHLALGLVTDVTERLYQVHALRGLSFDFEGWGGILMGPKGTKKNDIFFDLLKDPRVLFHAYDYLFVRYGGGFAAADNPERKSLMPTNTAELFPPLPPLFDRCRCENVVTDKEMCRNQACLREDDCRLDRGSPYCYKASKGSVALLDPYWLGGMKKHVKRIDLRHLFLLTRSPLGSPHKVLDPDEALRILEMGSTMGSALQATGKNDPFYNPHLILRDADHIETQVRFFRKLSRIARIHQINVEGRSIQEVTSTIQTLMGEGGADE